MTDIYLDYNATTPIDPAVLEVMLPYFGDRFGNAASSHRRGRAASAAVDRAREQVATLLGVPAKAVIWTSGSTEAINTVIKGVPGLGPEANLVVSAGEHKAVLDAAQWVSETTGCDLRHVPLRDQGDVSYEQLAEAVDQSTALVCVMAANNETGALTNVESVARTAHERGALVLCDTTQQIGKLPVKVDELGVDFAVASSHKIYGPQGVGALVVTSSAARRALTPLIHGGGHEGGSRSGTINLPGIVGFGAAAALAESQLTAGEAERLAALRDAFEGKLASLVGPLTVHAQDRRLPNTSNLRIEGVDADALTVNTPEVAMSSGSACTSAVPTPSHVLLAMGLDATAAEESVRFSLGRFTTAEDIELASQLIARAAIRVRRLSA